MRFTTTINQANHRATKLAKSLKLGRAALNLFIFPFYGAAWLIGRTAWFIRWLWGILVIGFRDGMGVKDES